MHHVKTTTVTRAYEVDPSGVVQSRTTRPTEPSPAPPPPPPPTEDAAYAALKEARSYHALTREALRDAAAALDAATRAHDAAQAEESRAAADLSAAKVAFDAAFSR